MNLNLKHSNANIFEDKWSDYEIIIWNVVGSRAKGKYCKYLQVDMPQWERHLTITL